MRYKVKGWLYLLTALLLTACATTPPYTLIGPGEVSAGSLRVTMDSSWNQASPVFMLNAREASVMWTHDGILLDRLVAIPDVADGEALFEGDESAALPVFRADMLPNEVAQLVESSIAKMFGEGQVAVKTSGLRPQRFGEYRGMTFDLNVMLADGPDYAGLSGGFIAGDKLQIMIFLGALPYYAEKHREAATQLITSARL